MKVYFHLVRTSGDIEQSEDMSRMSAILPKKIHYAQGVNLVLQYSKYTAYSSLP